MSCRPNRLKRIKKGLTHASLLGLPSSVAGEFKTELPKPIFVGESSEQETPFLYQGRSASPLKSYKPGMFPISSAFGESRESFGFSSPLLGMGDSVEYSQSRQPEGTYEDPLKAEMPFCMVLKDERSFTLPGFDGISCQEGGDEAVTLRSRGNEV